MRNLRWAAELSASSHDRLAVLGVAELEALLESDLLEESEKVFVESALGAVYEEPEAELDQLGDDVEVVQYVVDEEHRDIGDAGTELSSEPPTGDGRESDG